MENFKQNTDNNEVHKTKIENIETNKDTKNSTVFSIDIINKKISQKEKIVSDTLNSINQVRSEIGLEVSNEIPPSVEIEQNLIDNLKQEKLNFNDVSLSKEDYSDGSLELDSAKEEWRKSAQERFRIKDFNLETFKRIIFKRSEIDQAFREGKDWNYINDNVSNYVEKESYDEATKAFDSMSNLESERMGSVKELHEKFGIVNFQRYPKEILINQLNEIDKEKGVGLLAFAESDYNGAFDNQEEIWRKIYDNRKNDLNFRIVECASNFDLAKQLMKVKQDTGKSISLAFLSAHSDENGFHLGEDDEKSYVSKQDMVDFLSKIGEIFTDKAQLVGNACSSGALNGWIRDVSKSAKIKAVGPDRPAGIGDVDFYNNEIIPKYYNDDIYSNYYKGFIINKKINNLKTEDNLNKTGESSAPMQKT